ncbi:MAG: hypothetical protein WAU31_04340 [Candidatus Moraniibacteriota bacterium]
MTSSKMGFLLSGLIVLVIGIVIGGILSPNHFNELANTPVAKNPSAGPIDNEQENIDEYYNNESYGFQVKLPKGWEQYMALKRESNIDGVVYIDFFLPTKDLDVSDDVLTDRGKMVDVGSFVLWTKETWNREKARCLKEGSNPGCPDDYSAIGNNDRYFFSYSGPQALPEDVNNLHADPEYFRENIKFTSVK